MWVAGKTAWSLVNTCIPERFRGESWGTLQIQDRSPQLRPVASECVCYWLRDATGLDCGDRSWISNATMIKAVYVSTDTLLYFTLCLKKCPPPCCCMVHGDLSFTVILVVSVLVMLSTKWTQFGTEYLVHRLSERDKIWHIDTSLYVNSKIGELWPKGSPWVAKVHKWVKKFCNVSCTSFGRMQWNLTRWRTLVCSRSWTILVNFGPVFPLCGVKNLESRYLAHFLLQHKEIWHH